MKSLAGNRFSSSTCSWSDRSHRFLCVFSARWKASSVVHWCSTRYKWKSDVSQHVNRQHSPPQRGDGVHITVCQSQSCCRTAQAAVGQEPDGPLLRSLLLPPPQKPEPGAVFTLLITGEGPADRRAITDSPQAPGLGTLQTPAAVSQMWRRCPTVTGEPSLAKPKGPKRDIKDMRGIGRVGTNRGYAWEVEVGSWGHRQSVIQSKVGFGQGTNTDLHTHTHTDTTLL